MPETTEVPIVSPVTITPKAAEKLRELMIADNKDPENVSLRVFVQGGGCSGFQYGLMFNEEEGSGDQKFQSGGLKVVIDPVSMSYVKGAEIDYDEVGQGFQVRNPNAKSTCGCGQSFSKD